MSDENKKPEEEKKPIEAPAEAGGEKKDAGAQGACGWSTGTGCGKYVVNFS